MSLLPILFLIFVCGTFLGTWIHFCADRLPYEQSLLWPGSRCRTCLQPIRWFDRLPLISYAILGGRCRRCRGVIPVSTPLVELGTGLLMVGLFYGVVVLNLVDIPLLRREQSAILRGEIGLNVWLVFAYYATLVSLLLIASLCDLLHMEIPLSLTMSGTVLGLAGGALLAWPFPDARVTVPTGLAPVLPHGAQPWPLWYPLPDWLPMGSWQVGLATSLAGALVGMVVLRGVRFLFGLGRGIEGLGLGDADLMMMAGAFVGWQPILLAFFVAVFPALVLGILQLVLRGNQAMPFGPSLAAGVMITLLAWPTLGTQFRPLFFDAWVLLFLGAFGAGFLLLTSFMLRLLRGTS